MSRARQRFAAGAVTTILVVVLLLVRGSMASSGNEAQLTESARETGAEWIDRTLAPVGSLEGMELAPWQAGAEAPRTLGDVKAEVVLLCFWASYCEPCKREWPSMLALSKSLGPERMKIVAVSYDEEHAPMEAFFRAHFGAPPTFEEAILLRDTASEAEAMMKTRLGTDKIPETYVVRNGRILFRFVNERDWQDPRMARFFARLLAP